MRHRSVNAGIIVFGGKANDLKLWNLEQKTCTFAAKNVSLFRMPNFKNMNIYI
jgi:hypothetical protein